MSCCQRAFSKRSRSWLRLGSMYASIVAELVPNPVYWRSTSVLILANDHIRVFLVVSHLKLRVTCTNTENLTPMQWKQDWFHFQNKTAAYGWGVGGRRRRDAFWCWAEQWHRWRSCGRLVLGYNKPYQRNRGFCARKRECIGKKRMPLYLLKLHSKRKRGHQEKYLYGNSGKWWHLQLLLRWTKWLSSPPSSKDWHFGFRRRKSDSDQSLSLPSSYSKGSTDSGYFSRSESAEQTVQPVERKCQIVSRNYVREML